MLGWMTANRFNGRAISIDRDLWKVLQRMKRIQNRLDVEREVKDESFCQAFAEMMLNELRRLQ
jgi:hypothetical protein